MTVTITARLDFTSLPATDDCLQDWLRAQPGITGATVTRTGNQVQVRCTVPAHGTAGIAYILGGVTIEYTTFAGRKTVLDLTAAARACGYAGLNNVQFDPPRKRW